MGKVEKRKISVLSIVLYVLAGISAIYMIWSFVNVQEYVNNAMEQQQIPFKGNEYDIINTIMSGCGPYAFYAIALAVLGWILQKMSPVIEMVPAFDEQQAFTEQELVSNEEADELSVEETSVEEAVNHFETSANSEE